MRDLKKLLMRTVRAKGICAPGYEKMRENDIGGLVDYYVANPDWCMERDFPSIEVLEEYFTDCEDSEGKGVFVGKTFHGELLNERQAYIFHKCNGTIKVGLNVDKAIIPMLYLANGCRLRIVGSGDIKPKKKSERSVVPVYVFGENEVTEKGNGYVKFKRYRSELI